MSEGNVYRFGSREMQDPARVNEIISQSSGRLVVAMTADVEATKLAGESGIFLQSGADHDAKIARDAAVESLDGRYHMLPHEARGNLKDEFSRELQRPRHDLYSGVEVAHLIEAKYLKELINKTGDKATTVIDSPIIFGHDDVDRRASREAIRQTLDQLELGRKNSVAIVPSAFGVEKRRSGAYLRQLGQRGADRVGALYAAESGWDYTIWSARKNGVHSADPEIVESARLVPEVTRGEMRAIRSALFSHRMISDLNSSTVPVFMRSMVNLNSRGTRIVSQYRNADDDRPAVLIAGDDVDAVHVYQNGMGDKPGKAVQMLESFSRRNISIRAMPGNDDNQSFIFPAGESKKNIKAVIDELASSNDDVEYDPSLAMLHVAGQPMLDSDLKMQVQQKADQVLRENGIIVLDHETGLNTRQPSPGMSFLIARSGIHRAIKATHEVLIERKNPFIEFM